MKDFKTYIKLSKKRDSIWYKQQKDFWWKFDDFPKEMNLEGNYYNPRTIDYRNDIPIMENHTNIKNSEWNALEDAMGQFLIEWLKEHKKSIDIYRLSITRVIDKMDNVYLIDVVTKARNDKGHLVENKETDFYEVGNQHCNFLDSFITSHKDDLPLDWNYFSFSLDGIHNDYSEDEWCAWVDGYMSLGNHNGEEYKKYVCCL